MVPEPYRRSILSVAYLGIGGGVFTATAIMPCRTQGITGCSSGDSVFRFKRILFYLLRLKRTAIILFSCCIAWQLAAQQMRFIRYGMKEGLSHEMVNCLYNDSRGFLDRHRFRTEPFRRCSLRKWFHQPGDTNSLLSNKINSIAEDKTAPVMAGNRCWLSVYDMHRGRFGIPTARFNG